MKKILLLLSFVLLPYSAMAENLDLSKYEGNVVYLDFWASWCGPCRASFPWMQSMHQHYSEQGLVIIAVNVDQEPELAEAFLDKYPHDFQIHYDPKGELAEAYNVKAMPTSFLIGRDGEILATHNGFRNNKTAEYEQELITTLAE